jgi:hypothetical protein
MYIRKHIGRSGVHDAAFSFSRKARFSEWEVCEQGDVVLVQDGDNVRAGEIWMFAQAYDVHMALVSLWDRLTSEPSRITWTMRDNPQLVDVGDILEACVYCKQGSTCITLLPILRR